MGFLHGNAQGTSCGRNIALSNPLYDEGVVDVAPPEERVRGEVTALAVLASLERRGSRQVRLLGYGHSIDIPHADDLEAQEVLGALFPAELVQPLAVELSPKAITMHPLRELLQLVEVGLQVVPRRDEGLGRAEDDLHQLRAMGQPPVLEPIKFSVQLI